jgi:peptidoglycan/LPS O-acetylase OafA/YrhL
MQFLSTYVGGRDNNFNLLRFTAAFLVLFSHSFVLSTGDAKTEPLRGWLGMTPGSIAVDVFFVTSGFLVTGSLLARGSVIQFLAARALRIYPGLIVAVLGTTLVVGLFFSTFSFVEFLGMRETWLHVLRNTTLITPRGTSFNLPGVFANLPWPHAVNGSLWTLPYEVRMYATLALLWVALSFLSFLKTNRHVWIGRASLLVAVLALIWHFSSRGASQLTAGPQLTAMFFIGSAMYAYKDRIPMSWPAFWVSLAITLIASLDTQTFFYSYMVTLPYMVMFLAMVPGGAVRGFNRMGDVSYGLYIYAFPVQQISVAMIPGIGPWQLFVVSAVGTLVLAFASWHLIEKPALALKDSVPRRRERLQNAQG